MWSEGCVPKRRIISVDDINLSRRVLDKKFNQMADKWNGPRLGETYSAYRARMSELVIKGKSSC